MAHATCSIEGCTAKAVSRGWCQKHYIRWRKHGDPLFVLIHRGTVTERFWAYVNKTDTCWIWTGYIDPKTGYGQIAGGHASTKTLLAHRVAYEMIVGPIPDGLQIDHLCRNRACVNPAHMEPVTPGENVLRGVGITAQLARRTHCKHGHEFTPENTAIRQNGYRGCKECARMWTRAYRYLRHLNSA